MTGASSKDLPKFMIEQNRVFITVYSLPFIIRHNIHNVVASPQDQVGFLVFIRS